MYIVASNVQNYPFDVITYSTGSEGSSDVCHPNSWHGTDMGLASPVESLPVNGAEVGVTDDEVLDAAASRDMDFKLRSARGIMSSIIRDRTKSVPTGTALVFLLRVRLAAVLYRFRWVLTCSDRNWVRL